MSDMHSTVVLSLKDDLTPNARKATRSGEDLLRTLRQIKSIGKISSPAKFASDLFVDMKRAQAQARALHSTMSKPVPNRYRSAFAGINSVASAAKRAAAEVRTLNRALGKSPSYRGHAAVGSPRGGASSSGRGHSGRHHIASGMGHSFRHAFAFGAMEGITHSVRESVKTGMEQAFEASHTKAMLRIQGESQGDIDAAVAQSRKMAKSLPGFTSAQHLEAIAELRPALTGGLKEAIELAPMFQRSVAMLEAVKQGAGKKALGGIDTHGEALDLVRALEIGGLTSHQGWSKEKIEESMSSMVDGMTKSMVAFNGQIGAKDFHSAFKFARGDAANWSPEFATQILPTLMNELKNSKTANASQTGNALKSMSRVVMDGIMTPDALAKWQGLNMLEKGAFKAGKGGKMVKNGAYHGAALVGGNMWQENPYQWVQDYLLPHMKSKGIDVGNRKQVVAALGGLFGNRVANHIATLLATQQAIIEKDKDNVRKASGVGGYDWMMNNDPTARMQVFSASLKELSGAFGELAEPGVMRGMLGITTWAHKTAERVRGSAYAKELSGKFDSMVAGIFGQKDAKVKKGSYYDAGEHFGTGFSRLGTAAGGIAARLERMGIVTGGLHVLGFAANAAASVLNRIGSSDMASGIAAAAAAFGVFKVGKGVKNALFDGFGLKGSAVALTEAAAALKAAAGFRGGIAGSGTGGGIGGALGGAGAALIPSLLGRANLGATIYGYTAWQAAEYLGENLKRDAKGNYGFKPMFGDQVGRFNNWMSGVFPGHFSRDENQVSLDEIVMPPSFKPIRPAFPSAGVRKLPPMVRDGSALATRIGGPSSMATFAASDGIAPKVSTEAATGQMTTLMANLGTIAAKGVSVDVTLNTGAAEGQLRSLLGRLSGITATGTKAQFSKALSDVRD